jgi:lariat debranching enzyme
MHVIFPAIVQHTPTKQTKFLALSKPAPGNDFLQVLDIPEGDGPKQLMYDPEWLMILATTKHLYSTAKYNIQMPSMQSFGVTGERYDFRVTDEEIQQVIQRVGGLDKLVISPSFFVQTVSAFDPNNPKGK